MAAQLLDGGLVTEREFQIRYFDDKNSLGWIGARYLAPFHFDQPNSHQILTFDAVVKSFTIRQEKSGASRAAARGISGAPSGHLNAAVTVHPSPVETNKSDRHANDPRICRHLKPFGSQGAPPTRRPSYELIGKISETTNWENRQKNDEPLPQSWIERLLPWSHNAATDAGVMIELKHLHEPGMPTCGTVFASITGSKTLRAGLM
ncbi:hypothetical protein B0H63DRAFT_526995 [Podospora didyma]|uniref:Uncharacterized protein n=1 Tax=Podospora didyma TaxID=330526 RepID=A0AAE0N6J8_9PEZI|nr:hypothetical protein B0H63DRAFT_526995 [Podospora didyma]